MASDNHGNDLCDEMYESIKLGWEEIKSGEIKPFGSSIYLMYWILELLSESGYIDSIIEFGEFLKVWEIYKKVPLNKAVKESLIEEVDRMLEIASGKEKTK